MPARATAYAFINRYISGFKTSACPQAVKPRWRLCVCTIWSQDLLTRTSLQGLCTEVFWRRRWRLCSHNKWKLGAPPQAALFHICATILSRRRGELKRRWAKNCCLKTVCRPRRARVKAQVGQKLLPKDCLPAAPGASESPGGPKTAP